MSQLKKLAGHTALYGLSSILGRAINFLLVPFYVQTLSTSEVGIINDYYVYAAFFNILFLWGLETAYFRFASKEGEQKTFDQTQSLLLTTTSILASILIFTAPITTNLLQYPDKEINIYLLTSILAVDAIIALPFARLRHFEKPLKFASAKLLSIFTNIILNIFFIVIMPKINQGETLAFLKPLTIELTHNFDTVTLILLSNLIGNAICIPFLTKELFNFNFIWSKESTLKLINFISPLLFAGIAGMINEVLDRQFLKYLLPSNFYPGLTNQDILGIYGACYKLTIAMQLIIQSFRFAAEPFFFSKATQKDAPQTYALVMKYFIIACSVVLVSVSLFRDTLGTILFGGKPLYMEGLIIVPIVMFANLFLGIYYNQSIWYKVTEKTKYSIYLSGFGATITILFNLLLIPYLGYIGSAIATLLCYFSMSVYSYILGQKYYPVPYDLKNALTYLGLSAIIIGIQILNPLKINSLLLSLFLFIFYITFVFVSNKVLIGQIKDKLKR